ncbi:putative protein kinase [Leptomonas pyrrhocoris]|uniref:Protein kinase domain-containing protein n=1 Tax=Leptomonas pyrrhocoris TaxID=157538 RepID=A0A0N0E0E3_LEPPY|nr:putative protein kinase [Leptomonas pyrrhocoris]KPA86351.1 putative protein kinase [Leptomonas pyrrhocoris]|eukprot:XP_015664790.1 putative protein kinase [Leptomonas pyrrhocoris]
MSQRGLTFMLGTLLCAVVMGLGGGLAVYALLYRRAIRYQKCVFALCANLSYDVASSDGAHVASNFLESPGDDSGYAALSSTVTVPGVRLDVCDLTPSLSTLSRWHREVVALLDALAAPQAASGEVLPFLSVSAPHDPSPLLPSPQAREQVDRPFFNAVRAPGALTGGGVVARPFSATSEVCSIGSSSGPGAQRDRVEEVVLSRRPQHPADESRLHDVVTVVVCRFLVPPPLLAGQQPISKAQLKELESLSLEFHTRLRRAGLGRQVYMTECGIAEVVFSLNTVWPVQLLVANATAVALALAAQRELAEWSPKYRGQRVRWGVAVHRFRTVLRPARGGNGRLTLSFGTLEYDVARSLAQLAALCGYGVLCHADFFTDAMNEAKGLPVDYVMDCMQRLLLVYQLHDEAVPEGSKRSMADILSLMRGGRYTEASRRLKAWKEHGGDGAPFLPAAQHLLYVARFLTGALSHGERDGRYGTAVLDLRSSYASFASSPPLSTTAASLFSSFSEWLIKMLMQSYFRPPPIWEEDTNGASAGPQWHSFSSPAATGAAAVDNNGSSSSRQASPPPRLFHDVVRMADVRHGSSKRSIGGNEAAAPATPSRMTSHYFFPSVFSAPANAHSDPKKRVASPRTLFGNLIVSSGSDAHWLHSPLTLESSVRVGSNSLSLMTPPSALPDHWSARPAPAEHFPPPPAGGGAAVVSVSPASSRFSSTTVMTPVVLPQALQELQRRDPAPQPLNLDDAAQCANAATSSAFPNSLPRKVHVVQEDSPESPTLPPQSDSMQALHASAVSPIVPLPPGECLLAAPGGRPAEGVSEIPPPPLPQGGGARRARRKSSLDSRGSRSRGRSSSALPGTTSEEGELVGARVEAAPSFQPLEYQRGAAEGAICVPSSVRSAQSLTLSGRTQQRSTPYPTTLPLFLDSAATLPGVEDDEDDSGGGDHTNTTGGDPDLTSFAEVSRERSMTSVAQRSRSMKSVRAASTFAAVVCTRTRRITGDRIGMTQVFQGFHPQGYLVAIKQVDKRSRKLVQLQRNEIHLLRRLSHSNIVHFVGDWEDDAALCMAMEYACDTLTSVLDKFGRLLPGVVRHYVCGLLRALDYLHNGKGIVHRDVSPNNILITNASDSSQAKLIDFGRSMLLPRSRSVTVSPTTTSVTSARLSRQGPSEGRSIRSTDSSLQQPIHAPVVGTPLFMSPEACRGLVHPANDVWSVGVIMYLCLTGEYPYPAEAFVDPEAFIASVGSGRLTPTLGALPNSTSVEHDFIEQCLTIDYTKRPSAAALLNHPFIIV